MKIKIGHHTKVGDPLDGTFSSFGPIAEVEMEFPDDVAKKKFDQIVLYLSKLARRAANLANKDSMGAMRDAQRRAYTTDQPAGKRGARQGDGGGT